MLEQLDAHMPKKFVSKELKDTSYSVQNRQATRLYWIGQAIIAIAITFNGV